MSFYKQLEEYSKSGNYPFHMPGHKGGEIDGFFPELLAMDITEITGFDNLQEPKGILKDAQERFARLYGAEETFFLVNGSTVGILASIVSQFRDGDEVFVARNCHRSVYSALILSGIKPIYLLPPYYKTCGFFGGITKEMVQQLVAEYPKAKGLVLTSPTYEGITSDIAGIAEVLHEKEMLLVVDEAHGAYFPFHELFPKSAVSQGADIVVQSLHKTMPVMTQTALLHCVGERVDRESLHQSIPMVQTSSPSYILMASIDFCGEWLETKGEQAFLEYGRNLLTFRQGQNKRKWLHLLDWEDVKTLGAKEYDRGKLVFTWDDKQMSGNAIGDFLRQQHGLELELYGSCHMIAMTSPADTAEGFHRLEKALCNLETVWDNIPRKTVGINTLELHLPIQKRTPRQGFFASKTWCDLKEAIGQESGGFLIPYPPGVPILAPGEIITKECIEKIKYLQEKGIPVLGGEKGVSQICVIRNH